MLVGYHCPQLVFQFLLCEALFISAHIILWNHDVNTIAPAPSTPSPPALLIATTTSRQCVKAKMGVSITTSSQNGVRLAVFLKDARFESS